PVSCDSHEPPRHPSALRVIRFAPVPCPQEGVLQHFASQLRVAHDPDRQGIDETSIARVQRLEGGLVPEPHPADELEIGRFLQSCLAAPGAETAHTWRCESTNASSRDSARTSLPTE